MGYKPPVDDDDVAPSGWKELIGIIAFGYIIILEGIELARRVQDMACQAQYMARRAQYMGRLARLKELTYDSSHPTQFGETSCVVCLDDFTNTNTSPCEHICKECMFTYILEYDTCPVCKVNIQI
jgi:hypothetical protein